VRRRRVFPLSAKFKETPHVMGIVNSRAVMDIFMSPQAT
jgi:hypothetical protein